MTNKRKIVIFDMDDLMINSHPIHMTILEKVLSNHGADFKNDPLTAKEEASLFGLKILDALKFFIRKHNLEESLANEMLDQFNGLVIPIFKKSEIKPMPGLVELINKLKDQGFILAVASSAKLEKIKIVLEKLGLGKFFQAIVSGEDEIKRGKPNPDIFLKAAEKMGVEPEECVVLEDAENGVAAAKAAGMFCVGVHNQFTFERLGLRQNLGAADMEVNGLDEIDTNFA